MAKYQQVISLGFFCSSALVLPRISRRQSSYPFAWLITPDFSVVVDLIRNGFQDFLKEEYVFQPKEYPHITETQNCTSISIMIFLRLKASGHKSSL